MERLKNSRKVYNQQVTVLGFYPRQAGSSEQVHLIKNKHCRRPALHNLASAHLVSFILYLCPLCFLHAGHNGLLVPPVCLVSSSHRPLCVSLVRCRMSSTYIPAPFTWITFPYLLISTPTSLP